MSRSLSFAPASGSGDSPAQRAAGRAVEVWTLLAVWLAVLLVSAAFPLAALGQDGSNGSSPAPAPAYTNAPASGASSPPAATGPAARGSALPSGANVAVIRIEGTIYDFTLESLERRVDRALNQGASLIVIELDTPGGRVKSALDISKYIKTLPVPTVAWVNNEAYSAGILIASAADQIVMSPASATGDCAPILPGQEMPPTERAKKLTPILEEFRDNARNNGYDYSLFHAMCVLGVEVYYIQNPSTGDQRLVNQADYKVMVGGMSIDDANESVKRDAQGVPTGSGGQSNSSRWDIAIPNCEIATSADRGQWQPITQLPSGAPLPRGQVHDGRTLLTLNQARAEDVGLSQTTIANGTALGQHFKAGNLQHVGQTWSEDLAAFLVNPIVRAVLVIGLLVGLFFEFQSPGLGLGGAVAALALLGLLGAPFVVGLAEWWHVVVFVIGLALLITELAFVPGFGLLGIAGLIMMFAGLVLSAVPSGGGSVPGVPGPQMWGQVVESALFLLVGVFLSFVAIYMIARHFGDVPLLNRLVLQAEEGAAAAMPAGAVTGSATMVGTASGLSGSGGGALDDGQITVGAVGTVTTGLRPSGRAEIDGQIVDVVSDGQWIQPGQQVRVVEVRGNRVVVDEA